MSRVRRLRERAGLTQQELAARAGVSRQLVGAVETGRHQPRVDAALALARALESDVASLFTPTLAAVDVATGEAPGPGAIVRVARVGDRLVTTPARVVGSGFESADAIAGEGGEVSAHVDGGFVVAGCEPALLTLEQLLRERGVAAASVSVSSAVALEAFVGGRTHAAVLHGAESWPRREPGSDVIVRRLATWRVGICAPPDAPTGWQQRALESNAPVIQREPGAGVQRSFLAARLAESPPGPVVASHVEAASRSVATGLPAVTIEPAALAVGAVFHPLDLHTSELWIHTEWADAPAADLALELLAGRRLMQHLRAVGGYDLAQWGERVA